MTCFQAAGLQAAERSATINIDSPDDAPRPQGRRVGQRCCFLFPHQRKQMRVDRLVKIVSASRHGVEPQQHRRLRLRETDGGVAEFAFGKSISKV
jgi:hypothetical protein